MADDKKKEDSSDETKKKGVPAFLMIAVGALLGGGGVVLAVPPKTVEVHVEAPPPEVLVVDHLDAFEHSFNPQQRVGKGAAKVKFYFAFEVREDLQAEAEQAMEANWKRAHSAVLMLLKARSLQELNSEPGRALLERDLMAELSAAFWGAGRHGDRIAEVVEINWSTWLLQ